MGVNYSHPGVKNVYGRSTALACHDSTSAGVSLQAAYALLQQHASSQEQELAASRSRSPAAAVSSGPQSTDGGASSRLREMHGQLAQQDSQLAGARAENQVGDAAHSRPRKLCFTHSQRSTPLQAWQNTAGHGMCQWCWHALGEPAALDADAAC